MGPIMDNIMLSNPIERNGRVSLAEKSAQGFRCSLIDRYRDRLQGIAPGDQVISLYEGSTPLLYAPRLSERVGADVYLKLESANPTGSFKDRGMTVAVSRAVAEGAEALICASTGNTAASAAAYGARAGLPVAVLVPEGKIAIGKLAQAMIHGARVLALEGNFDQALELVRVIAERREVRLVNSLNEDRIEGQKTAAFEVTEELGAPPDLVSIPIGNAGNITAWWRGFQELEASPIFYGVQAEAAAPCVYNWQPVSEPTTVASAIRIGKPVRMEGAKRAVEDSGGEAIAAYDDTDQAVEKSGVEIDPTMTIIGAYLWLAANEGVFCEPASAASVAGLLSKGLPKRGDKVVETVVCVLTGHGLKDPETAIKKAQSVIHVKPELAAVENAIFD
jgi:threonine synthase